VYKSSETRLEIARRRKKLISRFPFFTALSSYLSVSLSAASVRAGACAPGDEKLRDLITGPVPFAKIIARVTSFSSTIIHLFFFFFIRAASFPISPANVRRSRYGTAGFYPRFRVRSNNETLGYVSRLENDP